MDIMIKTVKERWWWGWSEHLIAPGGTMEIQYDDDFPGWGWLCGLVVVKEERKKGIGRALMEKAEELIRESGKTVMRLGIEKDRLWIIEWYKRLGFSVLDMDSERLVYMEKRL